jgi:hypothetical protein
MIRRGTMVKFVGNDVARRHAKELEIEDWGPDVLCSGDSIINNGNDVIRVCYHMTGSFYFFELEEISHA